MTNGRITIIIASVLGLGVAFGAALSAGIEVMTPKVGPDLSDPRPSIPDLGNRTEASYRRDVEHCRGLIVQPGEKLDMRGCMRRNGYVVVGRS